jgi:hypothetical protein
METAVFGKITFMISQPVRELPNFTAAVFSFKCSRASEEHIHTDDIPDRLLNV